MKKIQLIVLAMLCSMTALAEVGDVIAYEGVNYKVTSEDEWGGEAEVVAGNYSGDVELMSYITSPTDDEYFYEVVAIGESAFENCAELTSIVFDESLTSIGSYAFYGCKKLEEVNLKDTYVSKIGAGAFYGCKSLKSVTLTNSVKTLERHLFDGCSSLTELVLPAKVETIADLCFAYCSSLTKVTLGAKVQTIGENVFSNCDELTDIVCLGSTPATLPVAGLFANDQAMYYAVTVTVPFEALDTYKAAAGWNMFQNIVAEPEHDFMADGLAFTVVSADELTVEVARGRYDGDIVLPATVWATMPSTVAPCSRLSTCLPQ